MCLSVVGCSSSKNDSSATKNQILYVSMKDIFDINTHLYTGEMAAQNMVFESLVVNNADREVEPGLAESWEISEDGLEYTFKLREDVTFTDGETKNSVNGYAGTGPFMLSEHEDEQYAVFTRNDVNIRC